MNLDVTMLRRRLRDSELFDELFYESSLTSTNVWAVDLVERGMSHSFLVLTDHQRAGRGRQGRTWLAPAGTSLLISLAVPTQVSVPPADLMFMVAVSMCRAVKRCTGLPSDLKWPNDIMVRGKKLGGLLGETVYTAGQRWAIMGVGVNVNFFPAEVPGIPELSTSVQVEKGHAVCREDLLLEYLKDFEAFFVHREKYPDAAFTAWADLMTTVGKSITVLNDEGNWRGMALAVRRDGSLRVRDGNGKLRDVYAGDVSVRLT